MNSNLPPVGEFLAVFFDLGPELRQACEGKSPAYTLDVIIKTAPTQEIAAHLETNREEAERCIAGILGYA